MDKMKSLIEASLRVLNPHGTAPARPVDQCQQACACDATKRCDKCYKCNDNNDNKGRDAT